MMYLALKYFMSFPCVAGPFQHAYHKRKMSQPVRKCEYEVL